MHRPVIEAQHKWMDEVFARDPKAVAVIESALIFEVARDASARGEKEGVLADWLRRIDRIIVVTAPDAVKIARYADRIVSSGSGSGLERNPSDSAHSKFAQGGFFLRKKPLDGRASGYTRSDSAVTSTKRKAIEAEARNRLAHQVPDAEKAAQADYVA